MNTNLQKLYILKTNYFLQTYTLKLALICEFNLYFDINKIKSN